jgi:hypothetical protein
MLEAIALVDEMLALDHESGESTLLIGDAEYFTSKDGPYPNHQMRVSVRPHQGIAALHYVDHDDAVMSAAYSYSSSFSSQPPEVYLIFRGDTGRLFPQQSIISIADARAAILEWLRTGQRPRCIEWRAEM